MNQINKIRIVLAEDHHVVRRAVATLLGREEDMEVVGEAADGQSLVEIVAQFQPDILVMDAQMPKHQPILVTKKLRQQNPNMQIVVLSAFNLPEYVVGLLKAGAAGYVLKDDPSDMLLKAIRAVALGRDWISPRVSTILIESVRTNRQSLQDILTNREIDVLCLMAVGHKNEEIATELVISEQTVKNHITNIFRKLNVETRVEAVLYAISAELVSLDMIKATFTPEEH